MSNQNILKKLIETNQFDPKEVGSDYTQFLSECSNNNISLKQWQIILVSYYENQRVEDFLGILRYVSQHIIRSQKYNNFESKIGKIDILVCQASYHLQLAITTDHKQTQQDNFKDVNQILNQIDQIIPDYCKYFTLVGFLQLYKGDLKGARTTFQNAILKKDNTIVPYIGLAQVEYGQGNFQEALKHLKNALKECPNSPLSVRLGMGYCFYSLKKYEMAYRTFQRVLDLDPCNVEALLGIANLEYKKQNYEQYFELIQKAFSFDQNNILVLHAIIQHYLMQDIKQNSEIIQKLASQGINLLKKMPKILRYDQNIKNDITEIKSLFYFALGYVEQHSENITIAIKFYRQALSIFKDNHIAQYCLGQLHIHPTISQHSEALKQIEQIGSNNKDLLELTQEINKPLAYLYQKIGNKDKYVYYYNKTLIYNPNDFESLIEYGSILIDSDQSKALELLEKASTILQKLKEEKPSTIVQPEIFNNIGVLLNQKKKFEKSIQNFKLALQYTEILKQSDNDEFRYKSYLCSIYFNLGCCYHDYYHLDLAKETFQKILDINPYYLESYNRIAFIEYLQGSSLKALETCEKAIQIYTDLKQPRYLKIDAILCLKGYIEIKLNDERKGNETIRMMDKKFQMQDGYSNLTLIYSDYLQMTQNRDNYEGNKKCLRQFADFLNKSLKEIEPNNIHSAHVLGCVMAEFGRPGDAKEIISQLKEYAGNMPSIIFNLAQLEFLQKNYDGCISEMKRYQEKMPNFNEQAQTQISLSYLLQKNYDQASKAAKKLILHNPGHIGHRYNYNIVLHEQASKIIQNKDQYKVQETQKAIQYLKAINKIYEYLAHDPKCRNQRLQAIQNIFAREKFKKQYERLGESSDEKALIIRALHDQFSKIEQEAQKIEQQKDQEIQQKKIRTQQIKQEMSKKKQEEEEKQQRLKDELKQKQMMFEFEQGTVDQEEQKGKRQGGGKSNSKYDKDNFINDEDDDDISNDDMLDQLLDDDDNDKENNQQEQDFNKRTHEEAFKQDKDNKIKKKDKKDKKKDRSSKKLKKLKKNKQKDSDSDKIYNDEDDENENEDKYKDNGNNDDAQELSEIGHKQDDNDDDNNNLSNNDLDDFLSVEDNNKNQQDKEQEQENEFEGQNPNKKIKPSPEISPKHTNDGDNNDNNNNDNNNSNNNKQQQDEDLVYQSDDEENNNIDVENMFD